MDRQERRFRAKSHIMGGGISIRAGQVVDERQLQGFRECLERAGGIEEISGRAGSRGPIDRQSRSE
jgi:hypothetical protein